MTTAARPPATCVPTLRTASANDSEFAFAVRETAFARYAELAVGWCETEERRLHARRFNAHDFRIITAAGVDVGVLAVRIETDHMKVNQLFILPEHQGKGMGAVCMQIVLDEARRLGLPVRLRVLKGNPRALAFYLRVGFCVAGETDTHILLVRGALPAAVAHPPRPA
jgi:GNAT superfamily N-acetyltransferase